MVWLLSVRYGRSGVICLLTASSINYTASSSYLAYWATLDAIVALTGGVYRCSAADVAVHGSEILNKISSLQTFGTDMREIFAALTCPWVTGARTIAWKSEMCQLFLNVYKRLGKTKSSRDALLSGWCRQDARTMHPRCSINASGSSLS